MERRDINQDGIVGTYFCSEKAQPGIVVVPGSDGGIPEEVAKKLATFGFTALALPYFGLPELPPQLDSIDLEYFENALEWMTSQVEVVGDTITLFGYSRGAELALLLGTLFPKKLSGIIACVPSSAICGGFPRINRPAWRYEGKPITPFIGGLTSDDPSLTEADDLFRACQEDLIPFHTDTEDDPYVIADLFRARNDKPGILEAAAIPVEKIQRPLLLLSGDDDQIWPSSSYCEKILERLAACDSQIERTHTSFKDAGHAFLGPFSGTVYHPVGKFWCTLGGSLEGNAEAYKQAWALIEDFLLRLR